MQGRQSIIAWLIVFAVSTFALAKLNYYTQDGDSVLHADIAANLAAKPVIEWIAPTWVDGLYREHPVGIFLLPAALASLGYPAQQAAYVLNSFYQIITLLLFYRIAFFFVEGIESRSLTWMLQLIPIAFVFRIRANHEQAILMFLLLALYSLIAIERRLIWSAVLTFALVAIMLIKGMFVIIALAVCAVWILILKFFDKSAVKRTARGTIGLVAAVLTMIVVAYIYDLLYRHVTGESFVSFYLARQLRPAAVPIPLTTGSVQKLYNFLWYLGKLLWYPFPWSLFFFGASAQWIFLKRAEAIKNQRMLAAGILILVSVVVLYLGVFSFFYRKAGRYIFPAYYFLAAGGAVIAIRYSSRLRRLAEKIDRFQPWFSPALWLFLFAIHILHGMFL